MNDTQGPGNDTAMSACALGSDMLDASTRELRRLIEDPNSVHDAERMRAMEHRVVAITDQLAGVVIGLMTARALEDPDVKDGAQALIRSQPHRMKNAGVRTVTIQPIRGEAFTVNVTYHHRKKKGSTPA